MQFLLLSFLFPAVFNWSNKWIRFSSGSYSSKWRYLSTHWREDFIWWGCQRHDVAHVLMWNEWSLWTLCIPGTASYCSCSLLLLLLDIRDFLPNNPWHRCLLLLWSCSFCTSCSSSSCSSGHPPPAPHPPAIPPVPLAPPAPPPPAPPPAPPAHVPAPAFMLARNVKHET